MTRRPVILGALVLSLAAAGGAPVLGQLPPAQQPPPQPSQQGAAATVYRPPLHGAPGGRVSGGTRGGMQAGAALPIVELLAPADHAGLTGSTTPTLYYFVSQPVRWPVVFAVSAPMQPAPVVETRIAPPGPGIHAIRLGDFRARLQPGIPYTWSVSVILNPQAASQNIIATATVMVDPARTPPPAAATPAGRAAGLAAAGLWYDAVAAAVETANLDRHASLDALLQQAGLATVLRYDQATAR